MTTVEKFEPEDDDEEASSSDSRGEEEVAWANYARELEREAADARCRAAEEEEVVDPALVYVEYPHPDAEVQLAKVQRFRAREEEWYAMVADDDVQVPAPVEQHAYARSEAAAVQNTAECRRIYNAFTYLKRAHRSRRRSPGKVHCSSYKLAKTVLRAPQSVAVRMEEKLPYLWVWDVTGPDGEGHFYVRATTDPRVFHDNRLQV